MRSLREKRLLTETMIMTIAVGMILTEIMGRFLNAGLPIAFPASIVGGGWNFAFNLFRVTIADLAVILTTVLLLGGPGLLFVQKPAMVKPYERLPTISVWARILGNPYQARDTAKLLDSRGSCPV